MSLYKVRTIEGKRFNEKARKMEYKVVWEGFPRSQATWQPENNLKFVPQLIEQFQKVSRNGKAINYEHEEKSDSIKDEENGSDLVGPSQFDELISHQSQNFNSMRANVDENKGQDKNRRKKRSQNKSINTKKPCRRTTSKNTVKRQNCEIDEQMQRKDQSLHSKLEGQIKNIAENYLTKKHEEQLKEGLQILKICRKDSQLKFLVKHYGQMQWVDRGYLIADHKQKLIAFYETKLKFTKKENANVKLSQSEYDLC